MSRLASTPITIPSGIKVTLGKIEGANKLTITNGNVTEMWTLHPAVNVEVTEDNGGDTGSQVAFSMSETDRADKFSRSMLGTDYMHVRNLITGMQTPFKTVLEIYGLGYRVKQFGNKLVLSLGKSHDDEVMIPENIQVEVPNEKEIVCTCHSKKLLGDFVAELGSKRKPDAYKAKGVRIKGKHYRTKSD